MKTSSAEIVIVGAGIVGLALARELKRRLPFKNILILEKEPSLGLHASGRNSGVLHTGVYYPSNTVKAKVCAEGARLMREYCMERCLPVERIGKIILPAHSKDDSMLDELLNRAKANGATAKIISSTDLHSMEPHAKTATGRALFVPEAAIVNPKMILKTLEDDLTQQGVEIQTHCRVLGVNPATREIQTSTGTLQYEFLINAAGMYADEIAKPFGVGLNYEILPFKGLYYELRKESSLSISHLLYPVPDLSVPFLGVHFTPSINKKIYVGPTAIPAFGKENYGWFEDLHVSEMSRIGFRVAEQFMRNSQGFRKLTLQEGSRFLKPNFLNAARSIVSGLKMKDLKSSDKVGIRAQLFDKTKKELVMDFVVEKAQNSIHVLNAVSPGFTSSMAFAKFILDRYTEWGDPI